MNTPSLPPVRTSRTVMGTFLSLYRGLPPAVWIQAVASLVNRMGGAAKMFMPIYLRESLGYPVQSIGWLLAGYGGGLLLGAYLFGALSDRYSPRRVMGVCFVLNGLSLLLLALPLPMGLMALVLFLSGCFEGGVRPVNQRLLLEDCPPAMRPRAHGLYRVSVNFGWAMGGVLAGVLAGFDYRAVFVADGLASLAAFGWFVLGYRRWPPVVVQAGADSPVVAVGNGSPWGDAPFLLLMLSCLVLALSYDQLYGMFPTFLREHYRLAPQWIGWLYTFNGLLIVGLQPPMALWIDRIGLWRAAGLGGVLVGCCWLVLPLGTGLPAALAAIVLLTLGESLYSPAEMSLVMQCSESRQRGRYLGLYTAVWGGRTLVAPAFGAQIYAHAGGTVLWYACAGLGLLSLWLRLSSRRMLRAEGRF